MTDHAHTHAQADTLTPIATNERARTGAVIAWWQLTTFLSVEGPEAISFLDAVASQNISAIAPGVGRVALFLTNKARIIAPTVAWRAGEDRVLLELDPALVDDLVGHLRRYRLRAKLTLEPVDLATVSVVGPLATTDAHPASAGWYESNAWGVPARTWIGDHAGAHHLVDVALPAAGLELADPEALDALRIERAIPTLTDLVVGSMPAEVGGVEVGVSLTKGCYLGQEPVARLHYRGRPNRTLRQVTLEQELPDDYFDDHDPGSSDYLGLVASDDAADVPRVVGKLTSWANSPRHGLIGLAVLRRELSDGAALRVAGTSVAVTPTALANSD